MRPLPEDIVLVLVRGLGAYLRATPAPDLPPGLRRLKGFRDTALARHRDELLALLDDGTDRALVLQWLDEDKPPISKSDQEILRLAAERSDGWEEALAAKSQRAETPAVAPPGDNSHDLEREREKTRKAKEELRKVRSAHEEALRAERARAESLASEIAALKQRLADAERESRATRAALEAERETADRETRRARAEAERAIARLDEVNLQLKQARKEAEQRADEIRSLQARLQKKKSKAAPQPPGPPEGPRKPLPVPKGRLEDDPATLDEWLEQPDVILVIDGYNVTKAEGGYGELELETQRERLIDEANKLARRKKVGGYIVFDGGEVDPHPHRTLRSALQIEYSAPGVIADDHIEDLIASLPPYPVVLVTNDRELQHRGRSHGATISTSNQFLALLH